MQERERECTNSLEPPHCRRRCFCASKSPPKKGRRGDLKPFVKEKHVHERAWWRQHRGEDKVTVAVAVAPRYRRYFSRARGRCFTFVSIFVSSVSSIFASDFIVVVADAVKKKMCCCCS
ncbi:hypothetical protein AHAS_Ahas12G0169700 [Arachis hypogaea]